MDKNALVQRVWDLCNKQQEQEQGQGAPCEFGAMVSSAGLHYLAKTDTHKIKDPELDKFRGRDDRGAMVYITNDIVIAIDVFLENGVAHKSVAAQMLLHILLIEFTKRKEKAFFLSLSDYKEYRHLSDDKTAREQLQRDLTLWFYTAI